MGEDEHKGHICHQKPGNAITSVLVIPERTVVIWCITIAMVSKRGNFAAVCV